MVRNLSQGGEQRYLRRRVWQHHYAGEIVSLVDLTEGNIVANRKLITDEILKDDAKLVVKAGQAVPVAEAPRF